MKSKLTTLVIVLGLLSACDQLKIAPADGTPTDTTHAIDGVKYISTSITRGDDERSVGQKRYSIDSSSRVLLRFESLTANQTRILATKPVLIRIFTSDATAQTNAVTNLRACPIVEDWMIEATWNTAHPYRGGEWPAGAPLEDDECISAIQPSAATGDCAMANAVCFDVSDWYKHYVVERGVNFGHALISPSGAPVTILGDGSPSKGPRIQWSE